VIVLWIRRKVINQALTALVVPHMFQLNEAMEFAMTHDTKGYEAQLSAMRTVMKALGQLDDDGRESVVTWIASQFGRRNSGVSVPLEIGGPAGSVPQGRRREGTVSVVAQKIGAKSARDLFLAAAAHLTLYQGKDSFTRDELVACAKEARGWKSGYSNQIAISIGRMLNAGTLFEKSKNVFSLSEGKLAELEGALKS
jgi:hypothetical protein